MPLPTLTGEFRCGSDIELRFAPSGVAVATVSLIASTARKLESGEWETTGESGWIKGVAFGKFAEFLTELGPAKGDKVVIAGKLKQDKWTTNEGEERTSMGVMLDGLSILQRKGERPAWDQKSTERPQSTSEGGESPWGPPEGQQAPQQAQSQPEEAPF